MIVFIKAFESRNIVCHGFDVAGILHDLSCFCTTLVYSRSEWVQTHDFYMFNDAVVTDSSVSLSCGLISLQFCTFFSRLNSSTFTVCVNTYMLRFLYKGHNINKTHTAAVFTIQNHMLICMWPPGWFVVIFWSTIVFAFWHNLTCFLKQKWFTNLSPFSR